jgi:hypothetical protein
MKVVKKLVRLVCRTSILGLLAVNLCGCLYLSNGKTQDVQFQSTPPGADVSVNGVQHGATPTTVTLSRCENYDVTVRKPGYTSANVLLSRSISGSDTILSFVDGVLILPGLVDMWNCSSATLKPNPITAELSPGLDEPSAPGTLNSLTPPAK